MTTRDLLTFGMALRALTGGGHSEKIEIVGSELKKESALQGKDETSSASASGAIMTQEVPKWAPTPAVIINPNQGVVQLLRASSNSALMSLIKYQTGLEPESAVIASIKDRAVKFPFSVDKTSITPERHDPSDALLNFTIEQLSNAISSYKEPPIRFVALANLMAGLQASSDVKPTDPSGVILSRLKAIIGTDYAVHTRLMLALQAVKKYLDIFDRNYSNYEVERTPAKMQLFNHWRAMTYHTLPLITLSLLLAESAYPLDGVINVLGDNGNSAGPFQINKNVWTEFERKLKDSSPSSLSFKKLIKDIHQPGKFEDFAASSDINWHAREFVTYYAYYLSKKGDPVYHGSNKDKNKLLWNTFATAFVDVKATASEGLDYGLYSYAKQALIPFMHIGNPLWDAMFEFYLHYRNSSTYVSSLSKGEFDDNFNDEIYSKGLTGKGNPAYISTAVQRTLLSSFLMIGLDMKTDLIKASGEKLPALDDIQKIFQSTSFK